MNSNLLLNSTWDNGHIRISAAQGFFISEVIDLLLWALHYELMDKPERAVMSAIKQAEARTEIYNCYYG